MNDEQKVAAAAAGADSDLAALEGDAAANEAGSAVAEFNIHPIGQFSAAAAPANIHPIGGGDSSD